MPLTFQNLTVFWRTESERQSKISLEKNFLQFAIEAYVRNIDGEGHTYITIEFIEEDPMCSDHDQAVLLSFAGLLRSGLFASSRLNQAM